MKTPSGPACSKQHLKGGPLAKGRRFGKPTDKSARMQTAPPGTRRRARHRANAEKGMTRKSGSVQEAYSSVIGIRQRKSDPPRRCDEAVFRLFDENLFQVWHSERRNPRTGVPIGPLEDKTGFRRASGVLCQRAVQMHVSSVHEQVLACDVIRLFREQEQHHSRDLFRLRHPFFQRNLRNNFLQLLLRIGKCR